MALTQGASVRGQAVAAGNGVTAGELVVEPRHAHQPRLRMVHRRRRQPQRRGGGVVPQGRRRRVAHRRCRCCASAASASTPSRAWTWCVPPMFAGSVLDLEPDTPYEVRLLMSRSRRRARATAARVVTVRTRAEPKPAAGGRVFHVYPHDFKGAKTEPSFEGLMCAYNFWCAGTDWATSGRPRVQAGDTILVHAGAYKYNRYEYTNNAAVNRTDAARRHLLPDREGHGGEADRHQGGRRRRGDLRRQRQLRRLRRARGRLHLLRGRDDPQRRVRPSSPARSSSPGPRGSR